MQGESKVLPRITVSLTSTALRCYGMVDHCVSKAQKEHNRRWEASEHPEMSFGLIVSPY